MPKLKNKVRKPDATGRSRRYPPHIRLMHELVDTPAFRSLSGNATKILLAVWRRHNGKNNGALPFASRDGEAFDMSKDTTARALSELVDRGFLAIEKESLFVPGMRQAREYRLTAVATPDQKPATHDYARWSGSKKITKTVSPTRQDGRKGETETRNTK
jgi:hypothetical protein